MTTDSPNTPPPARLSLHILARKNVLAGLMFIAIAALGLWVSRDYPIGTALRMGTGYVPRLLCWILMGLGAAILVQGLREKDTRPERISWRQLMPIVVVTTSLIAFALAIEQLGLVLSIMLLSASARSRRATSRFGSCSWRPSCSSRSPMRSSFSGSA